MASIAQAHFSGADDRVVLPEVARRFVEAAGKRCEQARVVPDLAHDGKWSRVWPRLRLFVRD